MSGELKGGGVLHSSLALKREVTQGLEVVS